jgi:molecular chaperone DnaJ
MDAASWEDHYEMLGLDDQADGARLRRAWRRLALRWHPDRAGPSGKAVFQRILTAYTVLSDPVSRAEYDRQRGPSRRPTRAQAPGVRLHRLSGPLNALIACGVARPAEDGIIDLHLEAKEAAAGGMVDISMRVPVRCAACAAAQGSCDRCGSKGSVDELFSAWLAVPPGVADGTLLDPSALLDGMSPIAFRVRLAPAAG